MFLKRLLILVVIGGAVGGIGFGAWGAWKFLKERGGGQYHGEETLVQRGFVPLGHWGKRDTDKRRVSEGPLIVDSQTLTIKNTDFFQKGNIIVSGTGKLIFQNSLVEMTPGETLQARITVRDKGELIFEKSTLKPHADNPANLYVYLSQNAKFFFTDSQGLHMIIARDHSEVRMVNAVWAYSMPKFKGGMLHVRDSVKAEIKNSVIGGLTIALPQSAKASIKNFKPGRFDKLDAVKEFALENSELQVILEESEILGEDLEVGGIKERGLSMIAPADITGLRVIDSELNKLVIQAKDIDFKFSDLLLDTVQNFTYGNIRVQNSKVMNQWGVFMEGGKGEIIRSEGLWLTLKGHSEISLKDSEIHKLDAEDFTGIIDLTESIWKGGGEITGQSSFTIRGSVLFQELGRGLSGYFLSSDSRITRNFPIDVFLLNPGPIPARGATIEVFDKNEKLLEKISTGKIGNAIFSLVFDGRNLRDKFFVKVSKFDQIVRHEIDFFTPTPIKLIVK